ncbi:MAG: hypothetical protein CSA34_07575 [Desulfobulbus propionicus]|nr:MAG: hypothetical protein CSA34_07575 [Desulfobulbus propionicus]
MLHFPFPPLRHLAPALKKTVGVLTFLFGLTMLVPGNLLASNVISGVTTKNSDEGLIVRIRGSEEPAFTVYELFNPARIVVDLAGAELQPGTTLALPASTGVTLTNKQLEDSPSSVLRLEFALAGSRPFKAKKENTDILLTISDTAPTSPGAVAREGVVIETIDVEHSGKQTTVHIAANAAITDYSYDVLDKKGSSPPRMYIDINNVTSDGLIKEKLVGTLLDKIRVAKRGTGLRIVMDSSKDTLFPFQIAPVKNGLDVVIDEKGSTDQIGSLIEKKAGIASQLPTVNPLEKRLSPQATEQSLQDAFSFSGYTKERISVDFYKIDLHNVFRLIGKVSGINIIVDEGVAGTLTLALDDVPWDFALDVILNLKNLQKEERFNTLVILPKEKAFAWSNKADNNLSFEPDIAVTEQESLLIKQQQSLSPEVFAAKEKIAQARTFEEREDFETAIRLYEQALEGWTDNAKLANRISSLYLVQLRQNAKAVFYAKKALALDKDLSSAALNAAIGLASMQEYQEAQQYFDQSISGDKPSKEALFSYAVFSEDRKAYDNALKLLQQHDELYGETLNSMIAEARLLDKKGSTDAATKKYKAILLSGLRVPPDLMKYIKGRIAFEENMN